MRPLSGAVGKERCTFVFHCPPPPPHHRCSHRMQRDISTKVQPLCRRTSDIRGQQHNTGDVALGAALVQPVWLPPWEHRARTVRPVCVQGCVWGCEGTKAAFHAVLPAIVPLQQHRAVLTGALQDGSECSAQLSEASPHTSPHPSLHPIPHPIPHPSPRWGSPGL